MHAFPASAPGRAATSSHADPIQAKFGFEVEMKVLLSKHLDTSRQEESAYGDPGGHYLLGRKGPFDVVVDHANGITDFVNTNGRPAYNSIIELRTDPIDEFAVDRDTAAQPMEQAAAFATEIEDQTDHFKHRAALRNLLPGAANDLTLGWERQPGDRDFMSTDGDIQVTFGLKLSQVPSLVRAMTAMQSVEMSDTTKPPEGHKDVLRTAGTAARLAIKETYVARVVRDRLQQLREQQGLLEKGDLKGKQVITEQMQQVSKTGLSEEAFQPFQELEGLVTLVCMYLVAGQSMRDTGQLDKNLVPLLVRHQLAELYATLSPPTQHYLQDTQIRATLRTEILRKTQRDTGEFLFPTRPSVRDHGVSGQQDFQDHNRCGEWIDRVLQGDVLPVTIPAHGLTDDISSYFGKMKQIAPEHVGPQRHEPGTGDELPRDRGVVMEQRMMLGAIPKGQWGGVARQYYDLLRGRNSVQRKVAAADHPGGVAVDEGAGQPLPAPVRDRMELAFAADFAAVRIHEGGAAPTIGALAYTQGNDIHFAPGEYDPGSNRGVALLGHELAHVVQQRQGRVASPGGSGIPINADPALEAEADAAGAAVAIGQRVAGAESASASTSAGQAGGPVQRKVGFEVEVEILLSKGGPSSATPAVREQGEQGQLLHREQPATGKPEIVTGLDLLTGKYSDPETLNSPYGSRMVVVETKQEGKQMALRWDRTSYAKHDGGKTALKPKVIPESVPGRWLVIPEWTPDTKRNEMYFDPLLDKSEKVFQATQGTPFDVVEDHVAQPIAGELGSIIEFVTDPRDEFPLPGEQPEAARDRFLAPIRRVRETVALIKSASGDTFDKRIPANQIFPGARSDLYLGFDGMSSQTHHGSLQATFGVQLGGIRAMMMDRTEDFSLLKEPEILTKAMKAASSAMGELGWDPRTYPRLDGLLHLICMYLVAGHVEYKNLCSLDKNHVPFLIRHGIPSIRSAGLFPAEHELLERRQPQVTPELDKYDFLFSEKPTSEKSERSIIDILARAADRGVSESLFIFSEKNILVSEWLRAVLFEQVDPHMDDFWGEAKVIPPEDVGPHRHEPGTGEPLPRDKGAILEQRHAAYGPKPPDAWEEIAETYIGKMQRSNR